MRIERIPLYKDREDVTLTAYILDSSRELPGGRNRPAVLINPGGAYLFCSDREGEPVAMAFAAMGYQTFVLRYSVYHPEAPYTPETEMEPRPHCQFPQPMLEIARAMLLIRDRAEDFDVDTGRIALCGFSAGGHNCAMYSVYWDKPLVTQAVGAPAESLRPAACILAYPVIDFLALEQYPKDGSLFMGLQTVMNIAYFGTAEPTAEQLHRASPARLADAGTPPTFIWATCQDSIVPVSQSTVYATALAEQGVPFELHVFERGEHGLSLSTQATAAHRAQIMPDAAEWVPLCERWLRLRLGLDCGGAE